MEKRRAWKKKRSFSIDIKCLSLLYAIFFCSHDNLLYESEMRKGNNNKEKCDVSYEKVLVGKAHVEKGLKCRKIF
jgi:hypothetical protein